MLAVIARNGRPEIRRVLQGLDVLMSWSEDVKAWRGAEAWQEVGWLPRPPAVSNAGRSQGRQDRCSARRGISDKLKGGVGRILDSIVFVLDVSSPCHSYEGRCPVLSLAKRRLFGAPRGAIRPHCSPRHLLPVVSNTSLYPFARALADAGPGGTRTSRCGPKKSIYAADTACTGRKRAAGSHPEE